MFCRVPILICVLAAVLAGCERAPERHVLRVFAAASMSDFLAGAAKAFEARGDMRVEYNLGPTSVLAKQIQAGAPCDVFIAADEDWMNALAMTGVIDDSSRRSLCGNRLVWIAQQRLLPISTSEPTSIATDFWATRRLAIADPEHVPAGRYARQALERAGRWAALEPRIIRCADVRAALQMVEKGEAEAGIVYASDVVGATRIAVLHTFDAQTHDPIRYPIAVCRNAPPAARTFVNFLTSADMAPLLALAGFTPSPASQPMTSRPTRATPSDWSAVGLSVLVASCATLVSVVPGVAVAWLLARRRFPGRILVDLLVHLPLVLPPVAVGFLLLAVLGTNGIAGRWLLETLGLRLAFTWQGAVLAAAVMGFPLLVRAARLAIELVDRRLEHSAATLGAAPLRIFLTITLPLALPGVLTGMLLAFARSLGEFGATLYFCGNIAGQTRTLPIAIYAHGQTPGGEALAWQLVLVSLLLSLAALLVSDLLARRMSRRLGMA